MHECIYICVYVKTYMLVYTYIYVYIYIYIYIYVYTYLYVYTCIHTGIYIYIYIYMYVYVYINSCDFLKKRGGINAYVWWTLWEEKMCDCIHVYNVYIYVYVGAVCWKNAAVWIRRGAARKFSQLDADRSCFGAHRAICGIYDLVNVELTLNVSQLEFKSTWCLPTSSQRSPGNLCYSWISQLHIESKYFWNWVLFNMVLADLVSALTWQSVVCIK